MGISDDLSKASADIPSLVLTIKKTQKRVQITRLPVCDSGSSSLTFGGMVFILFAFRFSAHGGALPLLLVVESNFR